MWLELYINIFSGMDETENYEETARPEAKRRSSILKIPKNRNPLEETYVIDKDDNLSKPARRVSFASSNFIKPFVTDPERNTIWDTTYEEDVNCTNSTQSSQEQILSSTGTKLASNFSNSLSKCSLTIGNVTNYSVKDMQLTETVQFFDKAHMSQFGSFTMSIVDFAKMSNSTVPIFNLPPSNCQTSVVHDVHSTEIHKHGQTMEVTCKDMNSFITNNKENIFNNTRLHYELFEGNSQEEVEMELSEINICEKAKKVNDNQKLTEHAPATKVSKFVNNSYNSTIPAADMEFTCQMPPIPKVDFANVCQNNNIQLPCQHSEIKLPESNDTEWKCDVSSQQETALKDTCDMVFTCQIPQMSTKKLVCNDESSRQLRELPQRKFLDNRNQGTQDKANVTNLDSFCKISPKKTNTDMEFTCQIPLDDRKFVSIVSHAKKCTGRPRESENVDKPESEIFPFSMNNIENLLNNPKLDCKLFEDNSQKEVEMEVSDINICEEVKKVNDNQKLTEHVLATKVPKFKISTYNSTMPAADMEFTCHIPPIPKADSANVCQNDNIQLPCQHPEIKLALSNDTKVNCQVSSQQKTALKEPCDMEFTCQISRMSMKLPNCNDELSRQLRELSQTNLLDNTDQGRREKANLTNLNSSCETSPKKTNTDMEFTCIVPPDDTKFASIISHAKQITGRPRDSKNVDKPESETFDNMTFTCQGLPLPNIMKKSNVSPEKTVADMEVDQTFCLNRTNQNKLAAIDTSSIFQKPMQNMLSTIRNQTGSRCDTAVPSSANMDFTREISKIGKSFKGDEFPTETSITYMEISKLQENCQTDKPVVGMKVYEICRDGNINISSASESFHCQNAETIKDKIITSEKKLDQFLLNDQYSEEIICQIPQSPNVSQIPIRANLETMNTPENFYSKECISELEKEPTPEPVSHINLTNISSGVDDTEHFLQYSFNKSKSFLTFTGKNKNDTALLNLEDTGHASKPNVTSIGDYDLDENAEIGRMPESADTSVIDVERNKLSTVNDTYILKNKVIKEKFVHEETCNDVSTFSNDASLGIIADEVIVEALKAEVKTVSYTFPKPKEINFTIKRVSEIADLVENVKRQRTLITEYLENFEFRAPRIPKEFVISDKSSSDNSESVKDLTDELNAYPRQSVEESIRQHQESSENCWTLENIDDDQYHFSTLFGTLLFVVELDPESRKVANMQTTDKLADNSKPISRYIMKLFLNRLNENRIRSALGDHYDVMSLLDYVHMIMLQLNTFLKEFMLNDRLTMDEDFVIKFKVLSVPLVLSFDIFINVNDIENLIIEKDMKIVTDLGRVNDSEIKNVATNCAKGLDFFKSFQQGIDTYLQFKQKRLDFQLM